MVTKSTIAKLPRAYGYVRVSTAKQVEDGGSLEAQREAIARHCVLSGYALVGMCEDAGISGGKGDDARPGLREALDAVRLKLADVIVVTHVDRFSRDMDEGGHTLVEIKRAGGRVDSIAEVKDDPIRKAVDRMLAELERIRTTQRVTSWRAGRDAKGLHTGPAPYGYRLVNGGHLEPVEDLRPVVDYILQWRDAGVSLRRIAAGLNNDGVPGPKGGAWNQVTVMNVVRRVKA